MGEFVSKFWQGGVTEAQAPLKTLQGWQREDLVKVFRKFKLIGTLTVDFPTFHALLGFQTEKSAQAAFDAFSPNKGRVDFCMVIGPMVAMSTQQLISRFSLLFSMYDFDGDGTMNHAELFIALRTLMLGFGHYFKKTAVPKASEVEKATLDTFQKLDPDGTDRVLLDDLLTFVYQDPRVMKLATPFPSSDVRIYEEIIKFNDRSQAIDDFTGNLEGQLKGKLSDRLKTTPDPLGANRPRASIAPKPKTRTKTLTKIITQPIAWVMWKTFSTLAKAPSKNSPATEVVEDAATLKTIPRPELRKLLVEICKAGPARMATKLAKIIQEAAGRGGDGTEQLPQFDELDPRDKESFNLGTVSLKLQRQLATEDIVSRLDVHGDDVDVSLREFCCLTWPTVPASDIDFGIVWCKRFRAQYLLEHMLKQDLKEGDMDGHDVQALFQVMDANNDGSITVEEIVKVGCLSLDEATRLVSQFDSDKNKSLSKKEIHSVVRAMNDSLKDQFKAAYCGNELSARRSANGKDG